ncbi:Hypothetical protein SMAX5B_002433 [Scophthalmus maximus]|uniref:Uncharacterized protein n=1 Tax=Scophthalmus maximus TaxID=52904 RepID=A0A2U9AVU0_SCOMX|nr:Hypothetical protein SMAX5B_002433 [Scophthalmus maximus]
MPGSAASGGLSLASPRFSHNPLPPLQKVTTPGDKFRVMLNQRADSSEFLGIHRENRVPALPTMPLDRKALPEDWVRYACRQSERFPAGPRAERRAPEEWPITLVHS